MYITNLCTHAEKEGQGTPTLKDVLTFLTGSDSIPPLGFGGVEPCIRFDPDAVLPTASTCALMLCIPLNFPTDFDDFKEKMDLAILGSQGFFGKV